MSQHRGARRAALALSGRDARLREQRGGLALGVVLADGVQVVQQLPALQVLQHQHLRVSEFASLLMILPSPIPLMTNRS